MFERLFEIEKEIENYKKYLQCGIYRVLHKNEIIFVEDKIQRLQREHQAEQERIKKLSNLYGLNDENFERIASLFSKKIK